MIIAGRLVNSDGVTPGQIRIEGERIVEVGPRLETRLGPADVEFGDDCLIFAGMGDIHIHARDDVSEKEAYKEDFGTAAAAALHGGVVHVADMPNNPAAPIDDVSYAAKRAASRKPTRADHDHALRRDRAGYASAVVCRSVQGLHGPERRRPLLHDARTTRPHARAVPGPNVSFHCEDPVLLDAHRGEPTHERRRPPACEISATRFALEMIEKYDLTGKLCHYSVGEGLPLIREARRRGLNVTCEVTPHHLFFDETQITDENRGRMQMNPPLRPVRPSGPARGAARRDARLPGDRPRSAHAGRKREPGSARPASRTSTRTARS